MFKKNKCCKCGSEIEKNFDFCPFCGNSLRENYKENWGMLGRNDFLEEPDSFQNTFFEGFCGRTLGKMLNSTFKMLEKEIKKSFEEQPIKNTRTNFELFINGKRINPKNIKIGQFPQSAQLDKQTSQKKHPLRIQQTFTRGKSKKFSKLAKTEPETNVRRLSDKIIYEINLPGVESFKDISISILEQGIEIKAISKEKAYEKKISINLPLIKKNFEKGKLFLELDAQG
jgi:HSP20 family molecular chaperone IbpA